MSEISEHADDLIEEFGIASKNCSGEFFTQWDADYCYKARRALSDYIAELEAAQRWISVDDELPEAGGQEVITLNRDGLEISSFYYSNVLQSSFYSRFSHWMPKPEVEE